MERGRLALAEDPPMDREAARIEANKLKDAMRESLRAHSERTTLPSTLRTMVKDCLRERAASYENSLASVMAIVTRLQQADQIAYWQEVAFRVSEFTIGAFAGCPIQSWEEEMDAVRSADSAQARAIVAIQTNGDPRHIEDAERLTFNQGWRTLALRNALHASRIRTNGRTLQLNGARA